MAALKHDLVLNFIRRDDDSDFGWSGAGGARWAFFAIFVVLIILIIFGTLRVNKRRTLHGVQPLYGTRWMTPPSYLQSERQYNRRRDPEMPSSYVPAYSAQANEYDMGYYDQSGQFHANPNAKSTADKTEGIPQYPDPVHQRLGSVSGGGVPISPSVPQYSSQNNQVISDENLNLYRSPPPQRSTTNREPENHQTDESTTFRRPSTSPPRRDSLGESSSTPESIQKVEKV